MITGWHRGYRPSPEGGNIAYTATSSKVVLNAPWIARIKDLSDGNLWTRRCGGHGWRCYEKSDKETYGVQALRSHLSGAADQEDWFVFKIMNFDAPMNTNRSEPRVRVVPDGDYEVEVCVYPHCIESGKLGAGEAGDRDAWAQAMGYAIHQGDDGGPVSPENSLLNDGSLGMRGYCVSSAEPGGAADIEITLEGTNRDKLPNNQKCLDTDVFVRVRAKDKDSLRCDQGYLMLWGNDQGLSTGDSCAGGGQRWSDSDLSHCVDCCDAVDDPSRGDKAYLHEP